MFNSLWEEKYRPKALSHIVLNDSDLSNVLSDAKKTKEIPNLLFVSSPGTGKTSLAKIIVNDILDCQYLYINASDESGIDTIRTKIISFAQTKSFDKQIKVIILDEADGITLEAQKALRNVIEEYTKITRFILTGNYAHKITPALASRCREYNFTPSVDDICERCLFILNEENIKDVSIDDVKTLVKKYYPDIRKIVQYLQRCSASGSFQINSSNISTTFLNGLVSNCVKDPLECRKYAIENEDTFSGDYQQLLRELFNFLDGKKIPVEKKTKCLITIGEYLYRSTSVIDQEINFFTCCLELNSIFK